MYNSG